ncbi:ABC transporter substrate-binding protein [Pseudooceanicola sp. CBS1P-1]|uniref:ABC transporter substrate-binding protein n=1 Tax=Pseudooceanicola albus TaxID=2692189 RepID=A0A6L7G7H7_9RHOB|nr:MULTISPECIES: ABC transporter substrate-binding protein [Pseudooceanicola]MBT9385957.1 ABC transporter substrate-binding protein [Pseudooceanicola endophyticus]MXN19622.1 ABC transporter substrate-binding protein [Pseudooceanicola albus]
MKTLLSALCLTTALALPALAQETPTPGGTLDVIVQPEPPGLVIGIVANGPAGLVGGSIYESLLRYDANLDPEPSLAKSWEISEDGLTYTFHLQDGVKWHDGEPFTADDVLFTLQTMLPKTLVKARMTMDHVESVTAPDPLTVVFKLKAPFEPFIRAFNYGSLPMMPKHIYEGVEDYARAPANDTPIGTGPFKFVEWKKGSYIKLEKFQDYYLKGKPYLDDVIYHIIPDASSRSVAFETGVVDVLPGGSVENFDVPRLTGLDNSCNTTKGWEFYSPLSWLWVNEANPILANVKIRQAMMYAMDRDFMVDVLWNGMGKPADGPITSTTPFYSAPEKPFYPHDPKKAKALLKEAGYDGTPIKLLPLPYGETWQRWAEVVRQNLEDVGFKVEMQSTDVAGWNQRLAQRDYDIAFTYLYQNGDPELGVARNYLSTNRDAGSPWNNVEGYVNPEVDKLFNAAAIAFPAEKRQELYSQVQGILREDLPVLWLTEMSFPTIYNCHVQNLVSTASGVNNGLRDAWIKQ